MARSTAVRRMYSHAAGAAWHQKGYLEDSNATGVGGNQADNSAVDSGASYLFKTNSCRETQVPGTASGKTVAGDFPAGITLWMRATGEVSLAVDDQYSTNAAGVITR